MIRMQRTGIKEKAQHADMAWGDSYNILWKVINKKKLHNGAEIGVAYGGHAEHILSKTNTTLYCVDPYLHFNEYDDPMNVSNEEFNKLFVFTKSRLKKFGSRVKMVRKDSVVALKYVPEKLDFVYIDADHSYEGVSRDIGNWFGKIREGGIVSGHDYGHVNFPGVKKAVDEFFGRFGWEIHSHKSGVWWVEKKPIHVSYIMPAYNCASTIAESVASIYNGNFEKGDELIVVDDKSADKTISVINILKKKYPSIHLIKHLYNKGGGAARNTAIEHANNPLIFCLDSDNILEKNSVVRLKKLLVSSKNNEVVSFQKLKYFVENIHTIDHEWEFVHEVYSRENYLTTNIVPSASGNYLFTKHVWEKVGGYPGYAGALDTWGFGLRQVLHGYTTTVLPNSSYYHRIGHDSYWVREVKKISPSTQALRILLEFRDQIDQKTQDYILSKKYRDCWFDKLGKHSIMLGSVKDRHFSLTNLFK